MELSGLDFKLGFRLLRRYPGLTIVGGMAMVFAIAVGASAFEIVKQVIDPRLPSDEGDRVVAIRTRNLTLGDYGDQTVRDLVYWRDSLTTVEQVSAFRTLERNLSLPGASPEPVQLAEMTASGFRVAGVAALLGRTLVEADEQASAEPVIVISHELWQRRFTGDRNVIGRTVRIGLVYATIVGVMPEGFGFPVAHRLWLPLRVDPAATSDERALSIFARLAPGATLEKAQAELTALGVRTAERELAESQRLRPVVEPYAVSFGISFDAPPALRPLLYAINLFFVMLLVLVCANVALLMFARAVTREGEIVVRNALGATRRRIVTQLFAEALVLGSLAAIVGLVVAHFALDAFHSVSEIESGGRLPFWLEPSLSSVTVLYTSLLTLIAAGIAGVVPALKMTGRRIDAGLRQLAAGGGGLRFGRLWTTVMVAQVAVTVAFPAGAFFVRRSVVGMQTMDVGFPVEQYLSARIELDPQNALGAVRSPDVFAAEFYTTARELTRRLAAEPDVASATLTDRLPRTPHPARRIELEASGGTRPDTSSQYRIGRASVDLNYFDALGARILAGRAFRPSIPAPTS